MSNWRNTLYGLALSAVCGVSYGQQPPNNIKTFVDCANAQLQMNFTLKMGVNVAFTIPCLPKIGGAQDLPANFTGCYLTLTISPSKQRGCTVTAKDGTVVNLPRAILNCPGPPPIANQANTSNLRFWPSYSLCPNPAWNNTVELGEDQINEKFAVPFADSTGQMIMADTPIKPLAPGMGPFIAINLPTVYNNVIANSKKGNLGCNECHADVASGAVGTLQYSAPGNPFGVFARAGGSMVPLIVFTNDPNQGINKNKTSPIPVKQDLKTVCANITKYKNDIVGQKNVGGVLGVTATAADVDTSAMICASLLAMTMMQ
jgi:hypothetical protein